MVCPVIVYIPAGLQTPTFLDLAEWPLPEDMDGESLKSVLLGKEVKREVRDGGREGGR